MRLTPVAADTPDWASSILEGVFGFPGFRAGQRELAEAQREGRDVLAVAPTGSGKSLSYWVPAIAATRMTLVVSPLVALMKDQVDRLLGLGVAAACLHAGMGRDELASVLTDAASGRLKLLYVAPERLARQGFVQRLRGMTIERVVVDEAHCISTWGHDFRPDYRRLPEALDSLGRPPVAAFTATATPEVRADIVRNLRLREPLVSVTGFRRDNLYLEVARCQTSSEKLAVLRQRLDPGEGRAIVYCGTVRHAEEVAAAVRSWGFAAAAYHSRLGDDARRGVQDDFAGRRLQVVVATAAFGMGVDIEDIRQVFHHHFPGSIEAYYQEAGRAGRDGRGARCLMLFNPSDRELQAFFIDLSNPERRTVAAVVSAVRRLGRSPLSASELTPLLPNDARKGVEGALALLHRAGLFGPDGELRDDVDLRPHLTELDRLRESAYARLEQVMVYATTRRCRHDFIAGYFGESGADRCEACDSCLSVESQGHRVPVAGADVVAAISCVASLRPPLGAARVAALLAGSSQRWIREGNWAERAHGFGVLRGWSVARLGELIAELLSAGLLRRGSGEYPVLEVTAVGLSVARGESAPEITLDGNAPVASPGSMSGEGGDPGTEACLLRLRTWRTERSRADGVPAYIVFGDRHLLELARRRPTDVEGLLAVPGVGPAKLERYGTELLGLLGAE
ncbi:MAG: RecQ family ATP-dependent DNA helicase [Candidatus Dormibacteria bacterium]